jgi:hypothetical protein
MELMIFPTDEVGERDRTQEIEERSVEVRAPDLTGQAP